MSEWVVRGKEVTAESGNAPQASAEPAPSPSRRATKRIAIEATGVWLVSRIALAIATYFAVLFPTSGPHIKGTPTTGFTPYPPHVLLDRWLQFDGGTALEVAVHGYTNLASAHVLPLYPLLTRFVVFITGAPHAVLAATLVSNGADLAALIGLGLLASREGEQDLRTLVIALSFPLAFILAAPTADSLFVALAVFSLFFARRGSWALAALCAFLSSLTSLAAVALWLALILDLGQHRGWGNGLRDVVRRPLVLLESLSVFVAVPVGIAAWAFVLNLWFGQPLAILSLQGGAIPPGAAGTVVQQRVFADVLPLLLVATATAFGLRRLPVSLSVYSIGLVILGVAYFLVAGPDAAFSPGRLLVADVPLFILLARWSRSHAGVEPLIYPAGFLFQSLFLMLWLTGRGPL